MRCRWAIGKDVNTRDVIGTGLSKQKQSRDGRLIWVCLSKCKQGPSGAAQRFICTCFTCPGDSGRFICVDFTCPGGPGEGHILTTYETRWVRKRRPWRVRGEGVDRGTERLIFQLLLCRTRTCTRSLCTLTFSDNRGSTLYSTQCIFFKRKENIF